MFPKLNLHPFWDDGGGGGGSDVTSLPEVPAPSDADVDLLGGEDDSPEEIFEEKPEEIDEEERVDRKTSTPKPKEEEKPDIDEEVEEEKPKIAAKSEEKEEESPDEAGLDEADLSSIRALKKDYPDIFKKHPQLRGTIAEHRQFRTIFSSVQEAQEATNAQQNFYELRDKVVDEADFGFLLDEVRSADPNAAARLVRKILPAVLERSKDLYFDITEEPITQFVHAAYQRASREGNQNLKNAALHFWKFLGRDGAPVATVRSSANAADEQMEQRIAEHESKKFQDASTSVLGRISQDLGDLISKAIDPKKSMQETTKRALVNDLIKTIDREIASDQNHMARINRLWKNAKRSNYENGHTSRIISAYLERAKQLLPKHARKVREELGVSTDEKETTPAPKKKQEAPAPRPMPVGRAAAPKNIRDTNPRSIDWNRTSDTDILSGKARLRR